MRNQSEMQGKLKGTAIKAKRLSKLKSIIRRIFVRKRIFAWRRVRPGRALTWQSELSGPRGLPRALLRPTVGGLLSKAQQAKHRCASKKG